mgnify:CR=1 FL=1
MKVVTAAIISKNGKFLIGKRANDQPLAGFWEFPGGKTEIGETDQEALARELFEEFSVRAKVGEFLTSSRHEYDGGAIQLNAYWIESWEGEFAPIVHSELAWVSPDVMGDYDMLPADVPISDRLKEGPGFSQEALYNRRLDIHRWFGGQMQGGISTPSAAPFIFLFTGESGESFGYRDGWEEGIFRYVGEGQKGEMTFKKGNNAIRKHRENGKELLLFEALGKSKPVKFLGQFECAGSGFAQGHDVDSNERRLIVFDLVPVESVLAPVEGLRAENQTIDELRNAAYEAARTPPKTGEADAKRSYKMRSEAVKDYVLARAKGVCEACFNPAPFTRKNGTPYLEPHHTKRIADSGPDHPRWVGAICPNCHREIHSGIDGKAKNDSLIDFLELIESDAS